MFSAEGWSFPWSVWRKVEKEDQNKIEADLPRTAKQIGNQKEIIDLEETVCLPRYQCGRTKSTPATLYNLAFTDQLNTQTVCITFLFFGDALFKYAKRL